MRYCQVQTLPVPGTFDREVWLVRLNTEKREVEVWDGSKWVPTEGDPLPSSFVVPYVAKDKLVEALSDVAPI